MWAHPRSSPTALYSTTDWRYNSNNPSKYLFQLKYFIISGHKLEERIKYLICLCAEVQNASFNILFRIGASLTESSNKVLLA